MFEKRKPTYDLEAFKLAFKKPVKLMATKTALLGAAKLGFGRSEITQIIQTIQKGHFHKSMTSYSNHQIWQDVYFVPSHIGTIYVKFTADVVCEFLLLSFKEKNNE